LSPQGAGYLIKEVRVVDGVEQRRVVNVGPEEHLSHDWIVAWPECPSDCSQCTSLTMLVSGLSGQYEGCACSDLNGFYSLDKEGCGWSSLVEGLEGFRVVLRCSWDAWQISFEKDQSAFVKWTAPLSECPPLIGWEFISQSRCSSGVVTLAR
jgi:hypothetical protein